MQYGGGKVMPPTGLVCDPLSSQQDDSFSSVFISFAVTLAGICVEVSLAPHGNGVVTAGRPPHVARAPLHEGRHLGDDSICLRRALG